MEDVIARMQDEKNGIPIRTVKSFLSKIPSVFSGKTQSVSNVFYNMHCVRQLYVDADTPGSESVKEASS